MAIKNHDLAEGLAALGYKENIMEFKVGDKVDLKDNSWTFGFTNGTFEYGAPHRNLTITRTGLEATIYVNDAYKKGEEYCKINDLLARDEEGNPWFIQSRFCKLIVKKIEVRYFCDGQDVTDSISDETKRNLKR